MSRATWTSALLASGLLVAACGDDPTDGTGAPDAAGDVSSAQDATALDDSASAMDTAVDTASPEDAATPADADADAFQDIPQQDVPPQDSASPSDTSPDASTPDAAADADAATGSDVPEDTQSPGDACVPACPPDGLWCGDDGCGGLCTCGAMLACLPTGNCVPCWPDCDPTCGDGAWMPPEACDDGNQKDGDGCSGDCSAIEDGWACLSGPGGAPGTLPLPGGLSVCHPVVCGDGLVDAPEQCDDENLKDGDGCSADCQPESGFTCDGSFCYPTNGGSCEQPVVLTPLGEFSYLSTLVTLDPSAWSNAFGGWSGPCDLGRAAPSSTAVDALLSISVPPNSTLQVGAGYVSWAGGLGLPPPVLFQIDDCADPSGTCVIGAESANVFQGTVTHFNASEETVTVYVVIEVPMSQPDTLPVFVEIEASIYLHACGDGELGGAEACEPPTPGQGCSAMCQIEPGFACPAWGPGPCHPIVCGDGMVDAPEHCDDGNDAPDDGCAGCILEAGWTCVGQPSSCGPEGAVQGDSCAWPLPVELSISEPWWPSSFVTPIGAMSDTYGAWGPPCDAVAVPAGGLDAVLAIAIPAMTEAWLFPSWAQPKSVALLLVDGCDAAVPVCESAGPTLLLRNETLAPLTRHVVVEASLSAQHITVEYATSLILPSVCGDGVVVGAEQCDDGAQDPGDGCSPTCEIEPGWACQAGGACHLIVCGDGVIEAPEACDDGAQEAGDGCSPTCEIEPGWDCLDQPSDCGPEGVLRGDSCLWPLPVDVALDGLVGSVPLAIAQFADDLGPWPTPCDSAGVGPGWRDVVLAVTLPAKTGVWLNGGFGGLGNNHALLTLDACGDTPTCTGATKGTLELLNPTPGPTTLHVVVEVAPQAGMVGAVKWEAFPVP